MAVPFTLVLTILVTLFRHTIGLYVFIDIPAPFKLVMLFPIIDVLLITLISILPDLFTANSSVPIPIFPPVIVLSIILQPLALI